MSIFQGVCLSGSIVAYYGMVPVFYYGMVPVAYYGIVCVLCVTVHARLRP